MVADALGSSQDKLRMFFFDNTDPDGIDRVLSHLSGLLKETLVVVISKSGGTPETRNGMLEAKAAAIGVCPKAEGRATGSLRSRSLAILGW